MNVDTLLHQYFADSGNICIEMFDEKNIQQVYRRLVEVLIHQPEVETSLLPGNHTLSVNGDMTVTISESWQGTIVYFALRSNMDIDPGLVVDHRTDPAEEFDELFPDNNPGLERLW